nr:homeotic protein HAT22 - Arabidopsis thaliana (fragments) [Arabidopsis thaliana]
QVEVWFQNRRARTKLKQQVEVWFQNRRARTKLKQTEVDCEFLKKCCETLTDENRRLQKELQDLKALKLSQPFS